MRTLSAGPFPGVIVLYRGLRSVGLALADLLYDRLASLGLIASVTAIVAPLLLLRGVENGALGAIRARFDADPRSREVLIIGSYELTTSLLARIRTHPDAAFVLAEPRYLNTTYPVRRADGRGQLVDLQFVATAPGDPLLAGQTVPNGYDQLVLSARAAERLDAGSGTALSIRVRRTDPAGRHASLPLRLRVVSVLPEERDYRVAGYVSVELLRALELWREGTIDAGPGGRFPPPDVPPATGAARLRLYARTLEGAPRLRRFLEELGIEARLREERIVTLLALSQRLDTLVAVLTVLVATGLAAVLAISGWQRVLVRRRELAALRLLSFARWELLLYPTSQTVVLTFAGFTAAFALARVAGPLLGAAVQRSFDLSGQPFLLPGAEVVAAGVVTTLLAALSALAAGWQAAGVEPAEVLHDA